MPTKNLTDLEVRRIVKEHLEAARQDKGFAAEYRDGALKILLDKRQISLTLRVSPFGVTTWTTQYRVKSASGGTGRRVRETLGHYPEMSLGEARQAAQEAHQASRKGINHRAERLEVERKEQREVEERQRQVGMRWENIVRDYVTRRLTKEKRNRSVKESEQIFAVYVTPAWKGRLITEISRRDVNELLDRIYDRRIKGPEGQTLGGPVMADHVLTQIRSLMGWYALRDDKYTSPIIRGMNRTSIKERARDRVLSDDELRAFWASTETGTFGAMVRLLLLTARWRGEVQGMRYSELRGSIWTLAPERHKVGKTLGILTVPLSPAALEVVNAQPRIVIDDKPCEYVFSRNGVSPYGDFSEGKSELDKLMLAKLAEQDPTVTLPQWQLHDLRRTARTLMARAGVPREIAERCLGHVIQGVEGTYDRYDYEAEMEKAFGALAGLIDKIVTGAEIVPFRQRRESASKVI